MCARTARDRRMTSATPRRSPKRCNVRRCDSSPPRLPISLICRRCTACASGWLDRRDFSAWLGLVPKQISTGDRTILGSISKRGNRYLRALFVQAAWVVLVKVGPKHWQRYGLKSWIEAAKKRLHHNVLAIALANKLARIAWAVLHKGRAFECVKTDATASRLA